MKKLALMVLIVGVAFATEFACVATRVNGIVSIPGEKRELVSMSLHKDYVRSANEYYKLVSKEKGKLVYGSKIADLIVPANYDKCVSIDVDLYLKEKEYVVTYTCIKTSQ